MNHYCCKERWPLLWVKAFPPPPPPPPPLCFGSCQLWESLATELFPFLKVYGFLAQVRDLLYPLPERTIKPVVLLNLVCSRKKVMGFCRKCDLVMTDNNLKTRHAFERFTSFERFKWMQPSSSTSRSPLTYLDTKLFEEFTSDCHSLVLSSRITHQTKPDQPLQCLDLWWIVSQNCYWLQSFQFEV